MNSVLTLSFHKATPVIVVFAVMALETFAIFANGAYFPNAMTLCVVGVWTLLVTMLFVNRNEMLANLTRGKLIILCLAVAFWLWVGLSMKWSISADQTWTDFNRTGGYLAVLLLGVMLGGNSAVRNWAVPLFVGVVTSAAAYGIGPRILPTVIENLEDAFRIAVPMGYANAMGLLMALAYPLSLYIASSRRYNPFVRIFMVVSTLIIGICLFFTASRGATLALAIGLLIYFAASPLRLRSFGVFILSFSPAILIALWASGQDAMVKDKVDMSLRLAAAAELRLYLGFSILLVTLISIIALFVGKSIRFSKFVTRLTGSVALVSIISVIFMAIALFVSSQPSLGGWARQVYHDFIVDAPSQKAGAGVGRLLILRSSGRLPLWEEALANWEDNPVKGTGAQSFPVVHLLRRESGAIFVKQAHGLGFSLLAELGLVGFLLMGAFIAMSLTYAALLVCKLRDRWDKGLAATIVSLLVIYLIHSSYDWDWNMFALTLPYFFFTGILLGWRR
ncbi:MAG: O-antigen ligase family protein [Thermoleophilia bacterium]